MPFTSNPKNLPAPSGTDRVMDGDNVIRALAQSVDNAIQAGTATVPITAVGTQATVNVTFPVPYAAPPVVVANWAAGSIAGSVGGISVGSVTATGFTIAGVRSSGAAPIPASWIAVGPVNAVNP